MRDAAVDVHLAWTCITGLTALTVDRRLAISSVAFLVGYLLLALNPDLKEMHVATVTNGVLLTVMIALWSRIGEDLPALSRLTSRSPKA